MGREQKRRWGITLVNSITSSLFKTNDYRDFKNTSFAGTYRYRFKHFNFRGSLTGEKDLTGSKEQRLSSGFLEISKHMEFLSFKSLMTIFQGRLNPPLNSDRRFEESHKGSLSAGLLFIITPSLPNLQLVAINRFTKNLHKWQIDRNGNFNDSFSNITVLAGSFFPPNTKWELGLNGTIVQRWNYLGKTKESLSFIGQSISYNQSQNLIFSLGHELGGSTFGYAQDNIEVAIFDKNRSTVFGSLTFNY